MQNQNMKLTSLKSLIPVSLTKAAALLTLFCVPAAFAADQNVFKTIGEDGSTSFTDESTGNSVAIPTIEPNVVTTPIPTPDTRTVVTKAEFGSEPADPRPLTVSSVEISSPRNDQTIINPRGPILIGIAIAPENDLPEGYTSEIRMNGIVVSSSEGTLLSMPAPDRGTHIIEARVLSATGTVQASSKAVTIHVRRSTVRRDD